ncbi:protein of unknown function [Nitrospira japonica]|uniref:Uncharacterized protein n=1 Tax=Nitrospira japonica TaxID=1325564 RepID=A0A1W1I8T6_9BACT|nr:protein of unknown function [Nitrospira japonica]
MFYETSKRMQLQINEDLDKICTAGQASSMVRCAAGRKGLSGLMRGFTSSGLFSDDANSERTL